MNDKFNNIFKNNIKVSVRSISVRTLLSDRNLKRINYKPYYQRNYVWDNEKATFFVESILLGTDVPPLILFSSGSQIEVIDGRQRFETLKRFKENSFKLTIKGLKELTMLKDQSFIDLQDVIRDIFLDTKVRLFEFSVVNEPPLESDLEDRIKKEIFRRYNTGITPISATELDNAKYDKDPLTEVMRDDFEENTIFSEKVKDCFFSNKKQELEPSQLTDFVRRYIILSSFPIHSYAGSGSRTETMELLYDAAIGNIQDHSDFYDSFKKHINDVIEIHEKIKSNELLNNKLVYECILWAMTVLKCEGVDFQLTTEITEKIKKHYSDSIETYNLLDSHYYKNIISRFKNTGDFFGLEFNINFSKYLKDENFNEKIRRQQQSEEDGINKMSVLEQLRLIKPEPSNQPVYEIVSDLSTKRYLLRPSYQREERINVFKASAIIESIILGIYLPPIFIFKNKENTREVIDGQQRILSILGFLGKEYVNDKGEKTMSNNHSFSLRGLKILKDFNGKKYSDLPDIYQEKILDFDLSIIEIDSKTNSDFDPVDLFIRLNNKPYPIKEHSFEMWNSTVSYEIVKQIKCLVQKYVNWFYIRVVKADRINDRMENEELITVLAYIHYSESHDLDPVASFYMKQDRLNSRINYKASITTFLNSLSEDLLKSQDFCESIVKVNYFIDGVSKLLSGTSDEDLNRKLTNVFNVRSVVGFRRSLQDIYLLWMVLSKYSHSTIDNNKESLLSDIKSLLGMMKNADGVKVDQQYMDSFLGKLAEAGSRY